jgi:isopentenyldiphosphate isomerase
MELFDVYDKYRQKTGRSHERWKAMAEGEYHLVVHVCIINDRGQFLIQKRQPWKIGWPNMWDFSAAGSSVVGDTSIDAATRETKEELGIQLDINEAEILFTISFDWGFDDIWLVRQNVDINELKLQDEEVADAKWVSKKEIKELVQQGEFINYNYFDTLFEMINSNISLRKAKSNEVEELLSMQKASFMSLYEKYEDDKKDQLEQIIDKFLKRFEIGECYKILFEGSLVGSVVLYKKEPGIMRINSINVVKKYQNREIEQKIMKRLELMHPEAESWEFEVIVHKKEGRHFCESMGYDQNGDIQVINDELMVVTYVKNQNLNKLTGF